MAEGATKQRIRTIDFFKGFAIFAIVCIHVITLHPREQVLDIATNPVIEFFYAGIMTFFLVSGYFYRPKDWHTVVGRVLKILVLTILAILVCTTLLWGYLDIIGQPTSFDVLVQTLRDELLGGAPMFEEPSPWGAKTTSSCFLSVGYYFLWSFAMATLLFYALADKALENDRNMVIITVALVAVTVLYFYFINLTLPFYLQLVPMEVAFMLVGAWMGRKKIVDRMEANWKDRNILITVVVSLVCGALLIYFFPTGTRFNSSHFGEYLGWSAITFFLIGLFCSIVLLYVCSIVTRIRYFSDIFIYIGKYTLQILLVSTFYAKVLCAPFYTIPQEFTFPSMSMPVCIALIIASIALSILTTYAARYVINAIKEKRSVAQ